MIKLLHISDIHINKTFGSKDKILRDKLKKSLVLSFKKAIDFSIHKAIDALLIAGDLFDSENISIKDKHMIINEFRKLEKHNIKIFYASGNHDFTSYKSEIRNIDYPPNVYTFFDDKYNVYDLYDKDKDFTYKIVGCGHMKRHETENLIESFPLGNKNYIGITHSMVESRITNGDEGDYLPSTINTIKSKGYCYFALGHIHQNGAIDKESTIYYSGSLQGLSSKESGVKGGNLVYIEDGLQSVEFIDLSSMLWDSIEVNLDDTITDLDELYDLIILSINKKYAEYKLENISIEIVLKGKTNLFHILNDSKTIKTIKETLEEELDAFNIKIKSDKIKTNYNKSDYMGKKSILGKVLDNIDKIDFDENEIEFINKEINREKLLEGLDELAIDYFLGEKHED